MGDEDAEFHWADYVVFVAFLFISLCIGVYFAYADRMKRTTEEFLLGGRSMNFIPVSLSVMASFVSGITILGFPAQVYYAGSLYLLTGVAFVISGLITCFFFIPMIHGMSITSAHEYFERRYGSKVLRIAVSLVFAPSLLFYMSVVLYTPALAFSEVTGLPLNFSILAGGLVCTLYTAMGGIKAVIWTDCLQMITMFGGLILMVVIGIYDDKVVSSSVVWDRANDGGRMEFDVLDADPRIRQTVWTQLIGWIFLWLAAFGTNQMSLQRYMSIKKKSDAQLAIICVVVGELILLTLIGIMALTMYAYYYDCDPLVSGRISKVDQIVPRYMMDIMGDLHGLPGLFTAAVFAGALSTVSSAVNSLATVTLEDFLKPIYMECTEHDMSQPTALFVSRVVAVLYGFATIGLSFATEHFGDDVVSVSNSISGVLSVPITGCFTLAMLVPWSTGKGCLTGLLFGVAMGCWLNIGAILHRSPSGPGLSLGFAGCPVTPTNDTGIFTTAAGNDFVTEMLGSTIPFETPVSDDDENYFQDFYDISYAWYGLITFSTVMIVGLVASVVHLGCMKTREAGAAVDPTLVYDTASNCCSCCPLACRRHVESGVPFGHNQNQNVKRGMAQAQGNWKQELSPRPGTTQIIKSEGSVTRIDYVVF